MSSTKAQESLWFLKVLKLNSDYRPFFHKTSLQSSSRPCCAILGRDRGLEVFSKIFNSAQAISLALSGRAGTEPPKTKSWHGETRWQQDKIGATGPYSITNSSHTGGAALEAALEMKLLTKNGNNLCGTLRSRDRKFEAWRLFSRLRLRSSCGLKIVTIYVGLSAVEIRNLRLEGYTWGCTCAKTAAPQLSFQEPFEWLFGGRSWSASGNESERAKNINSRSTRVIVYRLEPRELCE